MNTMFRSILLTMLASASADITAFIVGGQEASITDWPFIAFISIVGDGISAMCGGSLISSQTILTAAHCVDDVLEGKKKRFKMFDFRIYMGNSRYLSSNMQRKVIDYDSHEKYNFKDGHFDIAVMFLSRRVTFSKTVKKSILVSSTDFRSSGSNNKILEVAGWGSVKVPRRQGVENRILKRLGQFMYNKDKCRSFMEQAAGVIEGVICARSNASQFTYRGDSGGPLIRRSDRYLVGLVSIGIETGITVYTSVPHYYCWIETAQRNLFNNNCAAT